MKIESLKLKNFKSFKNITIKNIPSFCVVVGANGVGKTTLFDVFGFLKDCITHDVRKALQQRGGFKEVISRGSDPGEQIEIEIKFRLNIAGKNRLVTYAISIGLDKSNPVVTKEVLRYKRGQYGSPYHFLDFQRGKGYAISNEEDFNKPDEDLTREYQQVESSVLAIKGLGQFERFKAANNFRRLIEGWHISDFHINMARGSKDAAGYDDHLSNTGDNLQLVARNLFENHPKVFNDIIETMKVRVPGISNIQPIATQDGRLLLSFQDGEFTDPFIDRYVSDGTIKMFAYLVQLYDPSPHPLLCVEEPENQLYPTLLVALAEEFADYAMRGGQVFVSTHSPDFLNAVGVDEVFWLCKKGGYTTIKRAKDNPQIVAFINEGDQMGYLWKQGFFDGVDPI